MNTLTDCPEINRIIEHEATFGPLPHFLSTEQTDLAMYNAVGLIPINRTIVEALYRHPNLEQRLVDIDGAAFVVMEPQPDRDWDRVRDGFISPHSTA